MNADERFSITRQREYLVVKSNDLIQRNRFELSLQEQKTVAFICSMIRPVDAIDRVRGVPFQLEYEFNIRDYCRICGIDYNNGQNYIDVKSTLQKLRNRSMWLTMPDESESLVGWLSRVRLNKRSGIVRIEIDPDLAPYLFDLGQKFTQYQLYNVLAMKSAFSVRLYELLKSYAFQSHKTFDLDDLKHLLMVDTVKSYERFPSFRQRVLEPAQREINELTDINVHYETVLKGKKVVKIKFRIEQKNPIERMIAGIRANDRLGDMD